LYFNVFNIKLNVHGMTGLENSIFLVNSIGVVFIKVGEIAPFFFGTEKEPLGEVGVHFFEVGLTHVHEVGFF
jgi:hypothetical protein